MSKWDLYSYENEADKYIKMEEERRIRRQQEYASKLSPLYTGSGGTGMGDQMTQEEAETEHFKEFNALDVETQYLFNREMFFKKMKEPDFTKLEKVKTLDPKVDAGSIVHALGARPLAKPMKVYKFKTIDQETGAEVIVPQKEITVVAENEHNYYYYTKNGFQTVAKEEVSRTKIDDDTLKQRFMMQINKQAMNMAKNNFRKDNKTRFETTEGKDLEEAPEEGIAGTIRGTKLSSLFPTGVMGGGMKEPDTTIGDVEEKAKAVIYGAGDVIMTPINWVVDKIVEKQGPYVHDEDYFKKIEIKLKNGELSEETKKKIEQQMKMAESAKAKYPKGYSLETDVMAAGGTEEEVEMARDKDKEEGLKSFLGKNIRRDEELTSADRVAETAGEIVGTLAEFWALGGIAGAATKGLGAVSKAKWIKRGADAIITGGGYGFLEKLKERDAGAMETFKNMMEEAGFFWAGGEAANIAGKVIGPTRSIVGEVGKRFTKAGAFGAGAAAGSAPFMEEKERTPKELLTRAGMGAAFELGGGLLSKEGRKSLTYKIAKKKVIKKKATELALSKAKTTEFDKEFGLDKPMAGLNTRKKAELADEAQKKLVKEIGTRVSNKVGSDDPKVVMEYYKKKYDIEGDIKVSYNLKGDRYFARVEKRGKDIEVKINKDKDPKEVIGALRHEIEHLKDVGKGYTTTDVIRSKKGATTLGDFMQQKGHHRDYDQFEIGYLKNIYETELKAGKTFAEVKAGGVDRLGLEKLKTEEAAIRKQLKAKRMKKAKREQLKEQLKEIKEQQEAYRAEMSTYSKVNFRNEKIHATNRELTEASNLPTYVPPKKGIGGKIQSLAETTYRNVVNKQHALDKTGKKVKINAQNYSSYHGSVEYINTENLVTRAGRKLGNKSTKDVLIAPKGYQAEYESYLYHKAHINRMKQGKPIVATQGRPMSIKEAEEVVAKYEKMFPTFKKASNDLYQFLDDFVREWAVDGGLITKEAYEEMRKLYPDYVPAFRDLKEFQNLDTPRSVASNRVIKKAVGGMEELTPLSESIPVYIQQIVRAQRRNRIHAELLNAVLKNPEEMQKYAEIYSPKKARKEIADVLKNFGGEGKSMEDTLNKANKLLIDEVPQKGKFAIVLNEGKPITMKINDSKLWEALIGLQESGTSVGKMLDGFNKIVTNNFKNVVTRYNPFFAVRNIARDLPTAYIQGSVHNPGTFTWNIFSGMWDMVKKNGLYEQFKALGGTMSNLTKIEKSLKEKGMVRKAISKLLDGINLAGHISETLPRYNEFKAIYKRGMKKGLPEHQVLQEALYGSKEVTVNFGRGGDIAKEADKIFPYINAGVQGVDKLARTFVTEGIMKGNFAPIIKALGITTVPSIAFHVVMKNWGPKTYDDLPNWVVDNYYPIPISDTQYIRIPKNRETGFIFGTILERVTRAIEGDPDAFKKIDISSSFFNPIKEILNGGVAGPVFNIKAGGNKDYFGRDIEPMADRLAHTSKENITKETTSKFSKAIAPLTAKLNISPAQSDYLIDSLFGILGDLLLSVDDTQKTFLDKGKKLTGFFVDTKYSSKSKSEEYENKEEASRNVSDFEKEKGISDLKKQLKEEGVTSTTQINRKIEESLDWQDWDKYQELKEKKKELNKKVED